MDHVRLSATRRFQHHELEKNSKRENILLLPIGSIVKQV